MLRWCDQALFMKCWVSSETQLPRLQITFSRDWLAGSGKRSSKVTFSRDWLAGSGKRDAPVNRISVDADRNAVASRAAIKLFMEYLALQMEVIKSPHVLLMGTSPKERS